MILFGLAEVATGFTHQFFGVMTANGATSAYAGALIGVLYAAAGLLVLIMRKWAATLAIVCLAADVVGRVAMLLSLEPQTKTAAMAVVRSARAACWVARVPESAPVRSYGAAAEGAIWREGRPPLCYLATPQASLQPLPPPERFARPEFHYRLTRKHC